MDFRASTNTRPGNERPKESVPVLDRQYSRPKFSQRHGSDRATTTMTTMSDKFQRQDTSVARPTTMSDKFQRQDTSVARPTTMSDKFQRQDTSVARPTTMADKFQRQDTSVARPTTIPDKFQRQDTSVCRPTTMPDKFQRQDTSVCRPTTMPDKFQRQDTSVCRPTTMSEKFCQRQDPSVSRPTMMSDKFCQRQDTSVCRPPASDGERGAMSLAKRFTTITSGGGSPQRDNDQTSTVQTGSAESMVDPRPPRSVDVLGVRVSPAVVRFENTFENQSYTETVSVQNISDTCVTVRIHNPRAWSFRVAPLDRGHQLAPGLSVRRHLHYTCTKNGMVHSSLPIYVNESLFELPLEACKGQAFVEIIPTTIKFGRVDIGCKPIIKKILIKNVSMCATKFLVDLGSNVLDLHVGPMKGWIRPHSSVDITLQLLALREGHHSSELWITTDLCQTRIQVEVEACRRSLVALHPNTISDFTLVDFPITFYGCRRYATVLVCNMAASSSAFVVLVDNGSKGQVPFKEAKNGSHKHVMMFDVEPVEGRIRPFEERIFTFWFNPQVIDDNERSSWKAEESENSVDIKDYLCAVRIKRIQVDEFGAGIDTGYCDPPTRLIGFPGSSPSVSNMDLVMSKDEDPEEDHSMDASLLEDVSVLLYLYGEAEVASLSVIPDTLHFTNTPVGTTVVKVIHLTNNTNHMLAFQYSKIPFFDVTPDFKKLASKTTFDVTVKLYARNIGALKRNLVFDILALANATDKEDFHKVGEITVRIIGEIKSQTIVPEPKFNPGITPMITNEVGFMTDEVTFASRVEKPRAAVAAKAAQGRPWHQTDAIVAFPNDRPLTLRPRPVDAKAKTIYKGLARYVAPIDESVTYTLEKLIKKKSHDDWFLNYIRGTAALSVSKERCCKWMKNPPKIPDPPVRLFEEKEAKLPREVFVPLTFVQLYRIRVSPPLISFGSVTSNKSCTQVLSIENGNDFKISARIMPLTVGITVETLENFIICEKTESTVMLTFQREMLGRYSGTITCIINGYHSFDIALVAEVVQRSLTISPEYVEIKIPDVPFANLFVPLAINNPLNIPVTFSWFIPEESPIKIEPVIGVTPKRGTIWCVVFFEPDNPNYKLHPIKLMVEGTVCLNLKVGVVLPKTNTYFLESVLNLGYISMNLPTVRRFHMFNPDFSDAMFVVLNKEPVKGVKVKPSAGTIAAKSCFSLALHVTVPNEKVLDFPIFITLQNSTTVEMRVTGTVVYPEVEVTPQYINLHRVPCNSTTRTALTAENKSKATAEVGFDMSEFPQFKVSLSKKYHDPGLTKRGFTLEPGASQKFFLHFIPRDLASYEFYLPVIINNLTFSRNSSYKEIENQGNTIRDARRISVRKASGRTVSINEKRKHSEKPEVMSHLVLVDVVVLKATLVVSELELFFNNASETKKFSVTNVSDQPISIAIRSEDSSSHFDCQVDKVEAVRDRDSTKLTMDPGGSAVYSATFTATSPGVHVSDISVLVLQDDQYLPYNSVRLTGNIPAACVITPSVREVYFQPVPLNIESSFIFHLNITHNHKNKQTLISYEMQYPHVELFTVEYPNGNLITGLTKCSMPVKISFRSSAPMSVRKSIIFKGSKYGECSIPLIATADNCLLTTHAFLKSHLTYQTRLKDMEEFTEKATLISTDKFSPPPSQQPQRRNSLSIKETGSSSGSSSSKSLFSLNPSLRTCPSKRLRKRSEYSHVAKKSGLGLHMEKPSASDIDLSLQFNDKEEKQPSRKESMGIMMEEDEKFLFPMFPIEQTGSENAVHMNKTRNAVQQWVYEQVFCCSYNPLFGSHSFSSFSISNKKDKTAITPVAMRNVFDALERICGRRIKRFFTPIDKIPEDPLAKAVFSHNLYRQLLSFMEAQGALMAHVDPKYLLPYDEYCFYLKATPITDKLHELTSTGTEFPADNEPTEPLSAEKFESISVQCWLDLFLQMFKTLFLGPTVGVSYYLDVSGQRTSRRATILGHDVTPHIEQKTNIHGRESEILMSWLTHEYNKQRTIVWPNNPPPSRTVTNFDMDLEDGLVLTGVTAAYCPYLNTIHFRDMCLQPTTISQAYHNTTCLCMAWDSIKLGFSITPRDFVNPNMIKMLFLVTHLYKVLPSYKPEATITFQATLNSSESQIVTLENDEEVTITYHIEILPNNANFFLEDCENSFSLKRKSKGQVKVKYMARSTNKAEAILLLCGACMPPKFGRNYVFKLEGYPVKLPVSASFNVVLPESTPLDTQITVESPHALDFKAAESYSYDLWVAFTEPQPGNLNAVSWTKERRRKIPRRLFFTTNTLVVTLTKKKTGAGILGFKVCCFCQIVCAFWLIFRNPDIGDFIVKLQVSPRKPEPQMNLLVTLDDDTKCSCTSERSLTCSRLASVYVPCRNLDQWAAVRTMFELTITPEEKKFWATYIESNIGFRLMQWLLKEKKEKLSEELELIFRKSKTYKVSCSSKYIVSIPALHVPDVRCQSSLPIDLHFSDGTPSHSTVLVLTSEDSKEIRIYNLKVVINSGKSF